MADREIVWLDYYKKSLLEADANTSNNGDVHELLVDRDNYVLCEIDKKELHKWLKKEEPDESGDDRKSGNEKKVMAIEIAPVYVSPNNDGKQVTKPSMSKCYPFRISACMDEKGLLSPPESGRRKAYFLHSFIDWDTRKVIEMGEQAVVDSSKINLDKLYDECFVETDSWTEYWGYCEDFFKRATGTSYLDYGQDRLRYALFISKSTIGQIVSLYDQLIASGEVNGLLRDILKEERNPLDKELSLDNADRLTRKKVFLNTSHCGQMRCDFPMSLSQRVALAEYLDDEGNVFAVNGPPGTGKTTFLQSVIATLVVKSVLDGGDPLLMVGCSTNNQAITNILDSMGGQENSENQFACRWIPDVSSFGLYMTAGKDKDENKYQIVKNCYLNGGFVDTLYAADNESRYSEYMLAKAEAAFGCPFPNVKALKERLKQEIEQAKSSMDKVLNSTNELLELDERLKNEGFEDTYALEKAIFGILDNISLMRNLLGKLKNGERELAECHESMPLLYRNLPMKKGKDYRRERFSKILDSLFDSSENMPSSVSLLPSDDARSDYRKLKDWFESACGAVADDIKAEEERCERLKWSKNSIERLRDEYESLFDSRSPYVSSIDKLNKIGGLNDKCVEERVASLMDITHRYALFWYCVHYREIEFIEKLNDFAKQQRGKEMYEKKLRHLASVTPLFISTFHSLPGFCTYSYRHRVDNGGVDKGGYKTEYYTDLFDYMIVDEAGQVSVDVSIPSLSLTKRVLAVGDTEQIPPVFGVSEVMDFVNADRHGLIESEADFSRLCELGFATSCCSLMQLVKKSSSYAFTFSNGLRDKGAYLREHYRCLNKIIEYSNKYVYNECLILKGGDKNKKLDLPPLGYVNVNGTDIHYGNSRRNDLEARAIVEWIAVNKERIEKAYSKPIGELLAVVTPFKAQTDLIKSLLQRRFGGDWGIVVGTVHSLQGAGREVVLFSTVYGTRGNMFFDNTYNILNVALTRAKHSFLLFCNANIIDDKRNTPLGNLGKLLFSKGEELSNDFIYASEEIYTDDKDDDVRVLRRLSTYEKHDAFLKWCIETAQKRLLIFSPFITSRVVDVFAPLLGEAVKRNVDVKVITCTINDSFGGKGNSESQNSTRIGCEKLESVGVDVVYWGRMHNKTICKDDKILSEGSFNWLSAVRDPNSPYHRKEVTVVLDGGGVKKMISDVIKDFFGDENRLNG